MDNFIIFTIAFFGFSTPPKVVSRYFRIGDDQCVVNIHHIESGISNATHFEFELPFPSSKTENIFYVKVVNNGQLTAGEIFLTKDSKKASVLPIGKGQWTASGQKSLECHFQYTIKNSKNN